MSGHSIIIVISVSTLLLVIIILWILIRRSGYGVETAVLLKKMEETRQQLGVMDQKHDSHTRAMSGWLKQLLDRFGFLTTKKQPRTDIREDKYKP